MPEDREDTPTTPSDQPEAAQPAEAPKPDAPKPDVPEPDVLAAEDGPGAWTALAAPGKPDGEVDTRG